VPVSEWPTEVGTSAMRGEIETRRLVREAVARLEGGAPPSLERQAEAVGLPVERLIKLDQNENPYGCSLRVQEALAAYDRFSLYPDPEQRAARERLAAYTELPAGRILLGAGIGALVDLLCRLTLDPGDEVVFAPPTRGGYRAGAALAGARVVEAPRRPDFGLDMDALERAVTTRTKLIALASPNDPTGNAASPEQLVRLLRLGPLVALDESYVEFAQRSALPLAREFDNLVVLRSLGAWAGLAGLRVAYGVFPADLMPYLWKLAPPYAVSAAALAAVEATFDDLDHVRSTVMRVKVERGRLFRQLRKLNLLQPLPSQGNFLLCRVLRGEGRALRDRLADLGILVHWDGALPDHLRISVGRPEDTDVLLKALVTIAERL
jgi:histidinol-phosphate aminotransferase